ncbi:MAG: TlpA disulfide reductase family protein [Gemmatimonadota bacterium]|jgi:thiol-disulfide isomerase/thioredoxin
MTSMTTIAALALAFQAAPQQMPTTPTACLKAANDWATAQQRAAGTITSEVYREITEKKTAMARSCAAQFDLAKADPADLAPLVELYTVAGQPELAQKALDRALGAKDLTDAQRADVLLQAVLAGLREPKSDVRNARLETYVDQLDKLPATTFDQKFNAHARMEGYYRGDDIDAGIIKHANWMIDAARSFTPEQRKQYGRTVVNAHVNMAEAWAGQGMNDRALELLASAKKDWADMPHIDEAVDPTLARYELIGKPGAAIEAPRWFNVPEGTETLPMTGAVTLLEFTAHWCGPCRESYPGVKRLLERFGDRGFRVVLATELYGYFGSERDLSPDAELARDREYFAEHGLDVPVAIADERPDPVRTPDGGYILTPGINQENYEVGGIPQINILDRQGRVRLIMVGYDDANEGRLAALIESLLR